jgi:hypothetical protein
MGINSLFRLRYHKRPEFYQRASYAVTAVHSIDNRSDYLSQSPGDKVHPWFANRTEFLAESSIPFQFSRYIDEGALFTEDEYGADFAFLFRVARQTTRIPYNIR